MYGYIFHIIINKSVKIIYNGEYFLRDQLENTENKENIKNYAYKKEYSKCQTKSAALRVRSFSGKERQILH